MNWELQYNGIRRSLAAWGLEKPDLEKNSLAEDVFTFEIPTRTIDDDPPFPYGATLDLYYAGVRRFSGKVRQLPVLMEARRDTNRYRVANAWADLARTIFQDDRKVFVNPDDPDSAMVTTNNTDVVLFQNLNGTLRTNGAQIQLALQFAIAHGVALAIGTIDPAIKVPFEEAIDLTCAEVINRSCRWQPDVVSYVDYSTSPPTIHFRRRGNLSAVELDLDAGDTVITAEPSPCHELKVDGVKLFIQRVSLINGEARFRYQEQAAGSGGEGPGCIVSTIPCVGTDPEDNYVPPTLAADIYAATSVLQWEGGVRIGEAECTDMLRPGLVLNLTNGRASWASMNATIQRCRMQLDTGRTEASYGAFPLGSVRDFLELARMARINNVRNGGSLSRASGRSTNGSSVSMPQLAELSYCDTASSQTKKIYVPAHG